MSASAEVQGLHGDHKLELVSGDLQIHDLHGGIKVHTVSGDIHSQGVNGNIDLSSVSGDVALSTLNSETLQIHSVSGNIFVNPGTIAEGFNFETVSGDVQLNLHPESAFTVKMTSFSGDVRSDLPIAQTHNQMGHKVYEIQGGGPVLKIQSLSGNLKIRDKTGAFSKGPKITDPAVDSLSILEQVANGELSVDGAIAALKD